MKKILTTAIILMALLAQAEVVISDAAISDSTAPTRTGYAFVEWCELGAVDPFVFSTMPAGSNL